MLQDEMGAQALDVPFISAYIYSNIEEVRKKSAAFSGIIYYPALIPEWISRDAIETIVRELVFHPVIRERTRDFLRLELPIPYYGIHLRRTDLNVGLSDDEVSSLVRRNSNSLFFVCSDDPFAERLAAAHTNVRIRSKIAWVTKRNNLGKWNDITLDDDRRPYYSNVERQSSSVIEAVIDLLLLAHSSIVGYSGSTFQAVARMIGNIAPLETREHLPEIEFLPLSDCLRQLHNRQLTSLDYLERSNQLSIKNSPEAAITFIKAALRYTHGITEFALRFNLALLLESKGSLSEAEAFIRLAISDYPTHPESYILAARILRALNNKEREDEYLTRGLRLAKKTSDTDL